MVTIYVQGTKKFNFPACRSFSCSQDVLAQRSYLLARKFSMFYSALVN